MNKNISLTEQGAGWLTCRYPEFETKIQQAQIK